MRVLKKLLIRVKSMLMKTSGFTLRRFKLASRLLAGFLIVAVISAAMGIFALMNLKDMSKMSKTMYADILQPSQNVSEIQDDYQEMCIALRQLIVTNNESMTKKHISEINTGLTKILTVINATANQLKQVESTKRLEDLKKAFGTYSDVMKSMVGLYEKGRTDEIVDQLSKTSDLRNAERTMDAALDSLVYEVTSEASLINHDNTQTANTAFAITTAAVAAVLVLSSLIGFVIYKGISKPIKKLTVNLKQLAEGETEISSDKTAAKDELGQMESSFRQILTAIKTLESDTDMLIGAALEGALSVRADEQKHNGAYRKIVQGFNATLDAMMAPIDESTRVLYAFSQGSLNVAVEGEFKGDFARMKNALNSTLQTLSGYIGEISSVLQDMADGVLSRSIESEYMGDFALLKESINQCVVAFGSVIKEIALASEGVAQGAYQLSADSQTVSQGAAEQAGELESFTEVMRRVADMAKRNADSAKRANELAQSAKTDAASGNEKMLLLQNEMKLINASSAHISKIIKVIDDIAFKTNILALNAAVEAARAGVHGRGFAVVAQEVRSLAIQSADAARETQVLIENERSKTAHGTRMADETVTALTEILEDIKEIVNFFGEIDAASQEQANSMMDMDKGIEQLSKVVQNNLETAEHSAASSQELAAQAITLKDMVGRFSLRIH